MFCGCVRNVHKPKLPEDKNEPSDDPDRISVKTKTPTMLGGGSLYPVIPTVDKPREQSEC